MLYVNFNVVWFGGKGILVLDLFLKYLVWCLLGLVKIRKCYFWYVFIEVLVSNFLCNFLRVLILVVCRE